MMDRCLLLQRGLEQVYWQQPSRSSRQDAADNRSLEATAIVAIGCLLWLHGQAAASAMVTLAALATTLLQLLQLACMRLARPRYLRQRAAIMWVQRAGALALAGAMSGPAMDTVGHGTPGAAVAAVLMLPGGALLSSLAHRLTFQQSLAPSLASAGLYLLLGLPLQRALLQQQHLQDWAQPACSTLNALLTRPLLLLGAGNTHLCADPDAAATLLLLYSFLLGAVLLPLQLRYWRERASKLAFLAQLNAHGGLPGALPSRLLPPLYAWALATTAWGLLGICIALGQAPLLQHSAAA
jgi:hypothetical protein